uniref:Uncharacterized protein n=1 Tax=Romanomermis culicivorax TaxID=13658 RepID=A0A915IEW2_ROMCU
MLTFITNSGQLAPRVNTLPANPDFNKQKPKIILLCSSNLLVAPCDKFIGTLYLSEAKALNQILKVKITKYEI